MDKMPVMHVIPRLGPGGAERAASAIVKCLQNDSRFEVSICVLNGAGMLPERLAGLTNVQSLAFASTFRQPLNFLNSLRRFRALVAECNPVIVHSHLWPACRFTALALTGHPCHHVWHVHDTWPWLKESDLRSRFYRTWTKKARAQVSPRLVAVSKAAAIYTSKNLNWNLADFDILQNGVDLNEFTSTEGGRPNPWPDLPVLGLSARFQPGKGHMVLLAACNKLRASNIAFRLRLAGDGSTLPAVRQRVDELDLDKHVEFLGHVPNVHAFLQGLDLFVFPSTQFEGLPLSILEAMSCGVPVVATEVAGVAEVVRDRETGLLVPPSDSDAMADAITQLITNPDLRENLAVRGKSLVHNSHDWGISVEALKEIYLRHLSDFGESSAHPEFNNL